ncbi:MAG: EexN family lipoprotein [Pseudomonadota bacterium]
MTALLGAVVLCGCKPVETPRSVDDFIADPIAVDSKLMSCRQDRRQAAKDVECANARAAASRLELDREKDELAAIRVEAENELSQMRAQRERLERTLKAREEMLKARAERKLAAGENLTAEEAEALGIDPRGSLLVEPADDDDGGE